MEQLARVYHSYLHEHADKLQYKEGWDKTIFVANNQKVLAEIEKHMIRDTLRGVHTWLFNDAIDLFLTTMKKAPR